MGGGLDHRAAAQWLSAFVDAGVRHAVIRRTGDHEQQMDALLRIRDESGPEAVSIYTGRGAFELSLCDIYQQRQAAVSSA